MHIVYKPKNIHILGMYVLKIVILIGEHDENSLQITSINHRHLKDVIKTNSRKGTFINSCLR